MIHSISPETINPLDANGGMTLTEFTNIFVEIQNQPAWRSRADKEMDYVDGNQLDSDILQKQQALGIPRPLSP